MVFIPTVDGSWVSENYERLARIVQDYDPDLALAWIPPDKRTREDKEPYVIIDTRTNSPVLHATELESPEEILTRLFMGDNKHGNVLDRLEAANAAQKLMQMKAHMDELEDATDKAVFMINTPLHYIRDGRDEDGRLIRRDDTRRRI